jgi:hypothetical protein
LPQLLEVAAELRNEIRWISGGGRCCQKLSWNAQWFSVDELGHGRLQVLYKGRAHTEEDEGKRFGPTLLCSAQYGSLASSMHPLHKTIGGRMESRRAGQMDAEQVGQDVEQLTRISGPVLW